MTFQLDRGSSGNYFESSASTSEFAQQVAGTIFGGNHNALYAAVQVGADVQLFVADANGGIARSMVTLKNTSTSTIGYNNIGGVTPPPGQSIVGTSNPEPLIGGAGHDTLQGGLGADVLTGGARSDLFIFARGDSGAPADGIASFDVITDFVAGQDQIQLGFGRLTGMSSASRPDFASALSIANSALQVGSVNGNPDHVATVTVGADTYVFVDFEGFSNADMVIRLQGVTASPADLFMSFV